MNTPQAISTLRSQRAERRVIRQRNKKLEDELAAYSTPADRLELDIILSRHTAEEIAGLEEILRRVELRRPTL
jgi:hypothetical protein